MRLISICLLIMILISCGKKEKSKMISGRLRNAENSWIYLQKISEEGDITIDSVMAKNDGSFQMKNPSTSAEFYILRTNPTNLVFLILKPTDNVEVNGDAKNFEATYKVRGSRESELIQKLRSRDRTLSDSLNKAYENLRAENPENKDSVGLYLQEVYTTHMEEFAKDFIRKNLSSIVSLSATKFINQHSELALMNELRDSLVKAYPENRYVNDYKILINELNKLPPSSISPEIALKTPDGKMMSLSSMRGKIVLVDFWASWCGPCRRENPHLVDIYKKYKGKDFEILGVSLDENAVSWKNAIEKDGLTWPQVSELKKWESKVVKDFYIEAIPYSLLIGRDGKIISKGLRSDEMDLKIAEALRKNPETSEK
jgi:thiol-disulfide isomerase/thioredoxin